MLEWYYLRSKKRKKEQCERRSYQDGRLVSLLIRVHVYNYKNDLHQIHNLSLIRYKIHYQRLITIMSSKEGMKESPK